MYMRTNLRKDKYNSIIKYAKIQIQESCYQGREIISKTIPINGIFFPLAFERDFVRVNFGLCST